MHGGAICTLADVAIGTALRSMLMPGDLCSTVELKVNFIVAGRSDLIADVRIARTGKTTAGGDNPPGARTAMIPEWDGPEPEE